MGDFFSCRREEIGTMFSMKVLCFALVLGLAAAARVTTRVGIDNQELKDAMAEAGDTDSALDWTNKKLRAWGGEYKKILKGMPPMVLKDHGQALAGTTDLMGKTVKNSALASSKELQILAKAENRLEAAKEDVHEAQTAKSAVKRAQLEDLAQELSHEAVARLEDTKLA